MMIKYLTPSLPALRDIFLKHSPDKLLEAIEEVHQGGSPMSPGHSYKMIAGACQISFNTVHTHIKKVYEKLHINSARSAALHRFHPVTWFLELGMKAGRCCLYY
jgi:hypothetical protein